jgi:hypothetical protein
LDVDPHPWPERWPCTRSDLKAYAKSLDPDERSRTQGNWKKLVTLSKQRQDALMMRLSIGFFEIMGVEGWRRFHELILLMHNDPGFVREMMRINGEFVAALTERLLQEIQIDAAIFSEPIGDNQDVRRFCPVELPTHPGSPAPPACRYHHPAHLCQCALIDPRLDGTGSGLPVGL